MLMDLGQRSTWLEQSQKALLMSSYPFAIASVAVAKAVIKPGKAAVIDSVAFALVAVALANFYIAAEMIVSSIDELEVG